MATSVGVRRLIRTGVVLIAAAGLSACEAREPRRPNVLLVSIDTLRRDHVSVYGYERPTTPRIDALAGEGTLFLNALSTSNWTLPSHMSLMTGLPPSLHGVEDDGSRLSGQVTTLAQALRQQGYATGGVTSHVYLGKQYGFARGFDHYETHVDQRAESATDHAIGWLESVDEGSFFLFVHYFDPHTDYDPPEPFAERFGATDRELGRIDTLKYHWNPDEPFPEEKLPALLRLYDGEIAYTDHHIGRLLDWLDERGRLDETIVAVVSDHGEDFGDHGTIGHGMHLHGEVTRVPMVIRYPAAVETSRRRDLATLFDLPVTLLRLAGLDVPEQFELRGVDLGGDRETADGDREKASGDRVAIVESTRWGPKRFAVRHGDRSLMTVGSFRPIIVDDREGGSELAGFGPIPTGPALFDLAADPGESNDLLAAADPPEGVARLGAELTRYLDSSVRGVRMTCTANAGAGGYRVEVRSDASFVDEPFCLDAAAGFSLTGLESSFNPRGLAAYGFDVELGPDPVTIFLPVAAESLGLTVRMESGAGPPHVAEAVLPDVGISATVPFVADGAPRCTLEVPDPAMAPSDESSELSDEDLERLRSLGYVG